MPGNMSRNGENQNTHRSGGAVSLGKESVHPSSEGSMLSSKNINNCRVKTRSSPSKGKCPAGLSDSGLRKSSGLASNSLIINNKTLPPLASSAASSSSTLLALDESLSVSYGKYASSDESRLAVNGESAEQIRKHTLLSKDASTSWEGSLDSYCPRPLDPSSSKGATLSMAFESQDVHVSGVTFQSGIQKAHVATFNSYPFEQCVPSHKQQLKSWSGSSFQRRAKLSVDSKGMPSNASSPIGLVIQDGLGSTCSSADALSCASSSRSSSECLIQTTSDPLRSSPIHGKISSIDSKKKSVMQAAPDRQLKVPGTRFRQTQMSSGRRAKRNTSDSSVTDVLQSASSSSSVSVSERSHQGLVGARGATRGDDSQLRMETLGRRACARVGVTVDILGAQSFAMDQESGSLASESLRQAASHPSSASEGMSASSVMCSQADSMLHAVSSLGLTDVHTQNGRQSGSSALSSFSVRNGSSAPTESLLNSGNDWASGLEASGTTFLPINNWHRSHFREILPVASVASSRDSTHSPQALPCPMFVPRALQEELHTQTTFSGPPPRRPPPIPSTTALSQTRASFNDVLSHRAASANLRIDSPYSYFRASLDNEPQRLNNETSNLLGTLYGSQTSLRQSHGSYLEGLSEVLAALDQIEREEDISEEQILMLEATILLGGIGLHDQFRNMRLDVDNMSYEELLALEERMGIVATGLSEGMIEKCIKSSLYTFPNSGHGYSSEVEIKCSICQEEFVEAEELGMLSCGHNHHISCIKEWLRRKNQCPICKASASS